MPIFQRKPKQDDAPATDGSGVTEAAILKALGTVQDPDLHRDLVSLNMIRDIEIEGSTVRFTVQLTTPACPMREQIQADCDNAVKAVAGVETVEITMGADTARDSKLGGQAMLPGVRNTIAVASGKGGVGKSTVAVNLAVALAEEGASVGLLDADIYGPSIPIMLGVDRQPEVSEDRKMLPIESCGVKLMSIGFLLPDKDTAMVWRGPMVHSALRNFLSDTAWGELDYLVVDMPPGTGDAHLTLTQSIPLTGAVIVTTPQEVALEDARKAVTLFNKTSTPILGLVENMSYFIAPDTGTRYDIFRSGGGRAAAEKLGVPLLGEIPIDMTICEGGDAGVPAASSLSSSPQRDAFMTVAGEVAKLISVQNLSADAGPVIESN
ncbi:Mrp/NBP35 family ATP-binding protein [Candidatus Poribacteria bacterium]|jgi:ATP-binding protein involved in chromosome partitioning|nr:Mrp/NBP35 family ATP-binding protein [Candidatus Poribacteria bacterium]MBT5711922.1 Mrp/NBP35 family ATP-binding protein [Candidatus Poribacteria bacterium]MBT7100466.1 Mrp/NBP35 family ATP-binding protein [Candidatus Poribacteria bacterium]MBT7808272.1 Mrp/NBP35 family ATP-binding protein [Candidatus Poribacteria bacterium]